MDANISFILVALSFQNARDCSQIGPRIGLRHRACIDRSDYGGMAATTASDKSGEKSSSTSTPTNGIAATEEKSLASPPSALLDIS